MKLIQLTNQVNFGMVCNLLRQEKNATDRTLYVSFLGPNQFKAFRVYLYIHEYRTIPEYLNHYVHAFDTNQRGEMKIRFSKKIIYRHVSNGAACLDYGLSSVEHKSKDHCLQSCARLFFNYNYFKFLYLESDNVTMFSGTRGEVYPFCLKYCPDRCNTHYFEVTQIEQNEKMEESTNLTILAYRGGKKDSVQIVIVNHGIFAMNILTIIGFLAGFNLFALYKCLELYARNRCKIRRWHFKTVDLGRSLFVLLKFAILIAFVLHISAVFTECSNSETFKTVTSHRNMFVDNITITFCFKLKHLVDEQAANQSLNLKTYYLNEALSSSIIEVFSKVEIYSRNHFKDKQNLNAYLKNHASLLFFKDNKCWKVNINLLGMTGIHMNTNIVKYTTRDNQIKFLFTKPYDSVFLSEYNLYPNSNRSFEKRKTFQKSITLYSELFYRKRCLNYSQELHLKCGSRYECVEDCLVRKVLERYNTYPIQHKFELLKYKDEFKITEDTNFTDFEIDSKIDSYCRKKYPLNDCRSVVFQEIRSV